MTFGGHPSPVTDVPYEVTVKDKMCYHSITLMKAYENYSFEELRLMSPPTPRTSENILVRANNDGTYSANWTPSGIGWYQLHVIVDGYPVEGVYRVQVKDAPQNKCPGRKETGNQQCSQPSKVRKFVSQYSAGLRIRSHPSLQSEQISVLPVNHSISFTDEVSKRYNLKCTQLNFSD